MRCFGCEREADHGMITLQTPLGEIHLCEARGGKQPKRSCLVSALEEMYSRNRCPICHEYVPKALGFHVVCPACQESIDAGKRAIELQQASNEAQAEAFLAEALELAKDLPWYEPDRMMRTQRIKLIFAKSTFFTFAQTYIEKLVNDAFLRGLRFGHVSISEAIENAEVESEQLESRVVIFAANVRPPKEPRQ